MTPKKAEMTKPPTQVKPPSSARPVTGSTKPPTTSARPDSAAKPQTPAKADKLQTPQKAAPKVMAPAFEKIESTTKAAHMPVDSQETMKESQHDDSFETYLELEELKRKQAEEESKIVEEEFDFQLDRQLKDPMRETDPVVA